MRRALAPLIALAVSGAALAAGCRRGGEARGGEELERAALELVAASRTDGGVGPEVVDGELVELIRRIQLVRRATLDTNDRDRLLEVLSGESGPDRQYPAAERPRMQRERATRGLREHARGDCKATRDGALTDERMRYLTEPPDGVPPEVAAAQRELATRLQGAAVVRLACAPGSLGVLVVRGADGKARAADVFPLQRSAIGIDPDDPQMK